MDRWKEIEEFPGYSVSHQGYIRNDHTGRIMAMTRNQQGIVQVGLSREGEQYKRSVTLLVAHAFLDPPSNPNFDTPINLDGDRMNNNVDNLMWRPRWFAIRYHQQFKDPVHQGFMVPIVNLADGIVYPNAISASVEFGLLAKDITQAIVNRTYVFPTYQEFRLYEK